jgi:hypothetical protein
MRAWILLFFATPALASTYVVDPRTLTAECTVLAQDGSEQFFRYSAAHEFDHELRALPNVQSTMFGLGSLYFASGTIQDKDLYLVFKNRLSDENDVRVVISHRLTDKPGWVEKRVIEDYVVKQKQYGTLKTCRVYASGLDDLGGGDSFIYPLR